MRRKRKGGAGRGMEGGGAERRRIEEDGDGDIGEKNPHKTFPGAKKKSNLMGFKYEADMDDKKKRN